MHTHPDTQIAAIAAAQHGFVTWNQLLTSGLSIRQAKYRVETGRIVRVHPGVYRVAAVPVSPLGDHMAGVLATAGVVSHRSAAWLLGLWDRPPRRVELTLARPLGWRNDLIVHRLTDLRGHDVTTVQGIACTDAARLLVDMGAVCAPSTVEKLFHKALHGNHTAFDTIVSRFFQVTRKGRAGSGVLRAILEIHDPAIAPAESDLEVEQILVLRRHGLPEPVRQHRIELAGRRLRLDLAYPALKIAMEGDGFGIHTERGAFENDRARQNLLVLHGWLVLRSTWRMLIHTPWQVAKDVFDARQLRLFGSPMANGWP